MRYARLSHRHPTVQGMWIGSPLWGEQGADLYTLITMLRARSPNARLPVDWP